MKRTIVSALLLCGILPASVFGISDSTGTKVPVKSERNFVSFGGGLSFVPGNIISQFPEEKDPAYFESLRKGFHFHLEAARMQASGFGIGIKYLGFRSTESTFITVPNGNTTKEEPVRDKVSMDFIGAMLLFRKKLGDGKGVFTASVFLGQTYFKNNGTLLTDYTIRGSSGAAGVAVDWETKLDKNIGFILRASGAVGKLRNYDLSTGIQTVRMEPERDNYGSLAQLGLTAGFRVHF